jgi:ubiquinol-cytochrome c reductase iron-sulfur subunit
LSETPESTPRQPSSEPPASGGPAPGIIPSESASAELPPRTGHGWPVAVAALLAVIGGIGFAVSYVLDAGTGWLGGFLCTGFVGIAFGLAYWGRNLVGDRPAAGRYPLPAEDDEAREELTEELDADTRVVSRRWFLAALLAGGATVLGLGTLFAIGSLGPAQSQRRRTTSWRAGSRLVTPDGALVTKDALANGGFLIVFPENHLDAADSQVVLLRPNALRPLPGREDWSPNGFVAYSRLCTHAGCPVAQYEDEAQILLCPCHQSAFDVLHGAQPVAGPAGRALPQLPLEIDADGFLAARSDFLEPVGPGYWNLP